MEKEAGLTHCCFVGGVILEGISELYLWATGDQVTCFVAERLAVALLFNI